MYGKKQEEPAKIEIPFNVEQWDTMHTGIYKGDNTDIEVAQEHTLERLVRLMPNIKKSSKILVLGGPNSYAAIFLVARNGSKTDYIALTENDTKEAMKLIKHHDIEDKLTIHINPYNKTMFSDGTFDMIWSLDNIHTVDDKNSMMREAARLLVPEGRFIFCDYVRKGTDDTVEGYTSATEYLKLADSADLERVYLREMAADASKHHEMVQAYIDSNKAKLIKKTSDKKIQEITAAISKRKALLDNGQLDWAFFQFQKRNV